MRKTDWAFAEIFFGLLVGHFGGGVKVVLGEVEGRVSWNANQDLNSWVR